MRPIKSGLIKQNCYLRDVLPPSDFSATPLEKFTNLSEVCSPDGVQIVREDVPYHITPSYVRSFADSVDYRRNLSEVSFPSPSSEVRDLRSFQELSKMDSASLASEVMRLRNLTSTPTSTPTPIPTPTSTDSEAK